MNREERLVFLATLTPTLYAFFMWIEKGAFIFPFPLNEILFFSVCSAYLWWHYSRNLWLSLLIGGFACCSIFCSEIFLQFFLDGITWETFHLNILPVIGIFQIILLVCWFFYSLYLLFSAGNRIYTLFPALSFIAAFLVSSPLLLCLSFAINGYGLSKLKSTNQQHLLWYLLTFLIGSKSFTLWELG